MHDPSQPRARRTSAALHRRSVLVAAAGFLAVVLIAAVYMLAPARPGQGAASRTSTGIDTFANTAPVDAGLDAAIDAIIDANSQYQVGVALMATAGGDLHQYGVEEPFQAASTAKIVTAAYYHRHGPCPGGIVRGPAPGPGAYLAAAVLHAGHQLRNLIPAAVPDGVTVFHKYGLLDDELHDAAILSMSSRSYVLVVFTKGTDLSDIPERTLVIQGITKAVTAALKYLSSARPAVSPLPGAAAEGRLEAGRRQPER